MELGASGLRIENEPVGNIGYNKWRYWSIFDASLHSQSFVLIDNWII